MTDKTPTPEETAELDRLYRLNLKANHDFTFWFGTVSVEARRHDFTPERHAQFIDHELAVWEQDRNRRMPSIFRDQVSYWLARWRGMPDWPSRLGPNADFPLPGGAR